jgi:hypothetical protein
MKKNGARDIESRVLQRELGQRIYGIKHSKEEENLRTVKLDLER